MTRFAIAAVLAVVFAQAVGAQPAPAASPISPVPPGTLPSSTIPPGTVPPGTPLPPPPPPAVYQPDVYVPPGAPPGPAIPYHKNTGLVVGAYGFYPYDTGEWLLGGSEGVTRSRGSFTMVYPAPKATASVPCADTSGHKHGFFRR
ncbi:hypothetical protein [Frigoriglobus tundricola]|nr:hypothetical protein [Frigoriglobus tundricola]